MFERKGADGNGLRSLRNNLVFVVADETKVNEMKRAIVRRIALQELKRPERVKELAEHQQAKVFELEKKSETEAAIAIQQCYRHILYPSRNALGGAGSVQLAHSVIDIQNASERPGSGQLASRSTTAKPEQGSRRFGLAGFPILYPRPYTLEERANDDARSA